MPPGRLRRAALACALLASLAATACSSGREFSAGREGRPEDLGGLAYNVLITRQLNLRDPEDSSYFKGPPAGPGYAYYGVFISACNEARGGPSHQAASGFRIVDTQNNTFYPTQIPPGNDFAYRPGLIPPRACIPPAGTLASLGPAGGALLLFKLPIQATENRPMDLVIEAPPQIHGGRRQLRIELDI